jgi:hypothetical protein
MLKFNDSDYINEEIRISLVNRLRLTEVLNFENEEQRGHF